MYFALRWVKRWKACWSTGMTSFFEKEFHDGSYGYRPGRTQHDALRAVDRAIGDRHHWIIELDIQGYFDSIPHSQIREMQKDHSEPCLGCDASETPLGENPRQASPVGTIAREAIDPRRDRRTPPLWMN